MLNMLIVNHGRRGVRVRLRIWIEAYHSKSSHPQNFNIFDIFRYLFSSNEITVCYNVNGRRNYTLLHLKKQKSAVTHCYEMGYKYIIISVSDSEGSGLPTNCCTECPPAEFITGLHQCV